jgi:gluconokinase
MKASIVFMGVAGCGKSSIAQRVAQAEGCEFVEGDDFHSASNRERMSQGIALNDEHRAGWLSVLGDEIQRHPQGVVLTCSALRKAYRDRLRQCALNLKFVFLDLEKNEALRRVTARSGAHFFSATLVDSQFATLESPAGEEGVLRLDASLPLETLQAQVFDWLRAYD